MKKQNYFSIILVVFLMLFFIISCLDKQDTDESSPLTSIMENLSSLNIIMPESFAVASNTESSTTDSTIDSYEVKIDRIQKVLKATRLIDCDKAIPPLDQSPQKPVCYGPSLLYTSHPDYDPSTDATSDGMLPGGDLGLWTAKEGATDKACAVAQMNYLVASVTKKIDTAMGMEAMMVCSARITGKKLPKAGETLDLESPVTLLGGNRINITSASVKRATKLSGDRPIFISRLGGTFTTTSGGTDYENPFTIIWKHIPKSKTISTENGLMQMVLTNQGDASTDMAISILYSKNTDASLQYRMTSARFRAVAADQRMSTYFNAIDVKDPNQVKSKPSTLAPNIATGHDGWLKDYNLLIANISSKTGAGRVTYSWQAGNLDGHTRTLNVKTDDNGTGSAYFGFAKNPTLSGEYGPSLIDGMICNWAGPGAASGGGKTIVTKVQKQSISKNSSGLWVLDQSWITYAPTNSCDWNDNAFSSSTFQGLTFPVTNNLYPLGTYKVEFAQLVVPGDIN